jgi:hypothetical protein
MGLPNPKTISALSAALLLRRKAFSAMALTGMALTGAVLTGAALSGAIFKGTAALAEPSATPWAGQGSDQVQKLKSQRLEAISAMGAAQRHGFFQAQRSLEERFYRQRLSRLDQSERCLDQARDKGAVDACLKAAQQARRDLRHQEMMEWQALNQRFGLPIPQGRGIKQKGSGDQPKSGF